MRMGHPIIKRLGIYYTHESRHHSPSIFGFQKYAPYFTIPLSAPFIWLNWSRINVNPAKTGDAEMAGALSSDPNPSGQNHIPKKALQIQRKEKM